MRPHPLLLLALGCTEYGLALKPSDVETDDPETDVAVPETDTVAPIDTGALPSCEAASIQASAWIASTPFGAQDDPIDDAGKAFYEADFTATGWQAVTLPDVGAVPAGNDRVYRGTVVVTGAPPSVLVEMQSDDGLALWIDGQPVGTWGGAWQQEGCVNDAANCLTFTEVDPVDVSARLGEGTHLVAARVSNPVENAYLDLRFRCAETRP